VSKDTPSSRKAPRCPICGKPTVERYRPFCSSRCADVDLHRWLGGRYAIPAVEPPDFEEARGEPEKPATPRR
jgi:endogenous inhibitor of DNA gyrase (YacG/DUF329 family)